MSFVEQEDVIQMFEGLMKHLFKTLKGIDFTDPFPRMTWEDAMNGYGSDKPDLRFGMKFVELKDIIPAGQFSVFDDAPYVAGICAEGCASYTRKQLDQLTDFVKRSQVGAKGLIWVRVDENGVLKSSVDKFYTPETLAVWADRFGAKPGDLMLILCGEKRRTQKQLCALRLEMGQRLGLMDKSRFVPLWVIDFPLFEWDDETQRFYATHHPFTMPNPDDIPLLDTDPGRVRAWAYDCVVNGVELGGGSVRIHDSQLQERMFELLGFTPEKAMAQFGCLINAFRFGAPPHAGLAFGLDRVVSMFAELDSIRDCIAFPKNNAGRDTMMDAPTAIDQAQLDELQLALNLKGE
jgi:aspartyl-tRNA synthetase